MPVNIFNAKSTGIVKDLKSNQKGRSTRTGTGIQSNKFYITDCLLVSCFFVFFNQGTNFYLAALWYS